MSDLKPCPCCGSEVVIFEQHKKDGYRIKCKNCALKREQRALLYSMEWLESKMKENWNNRPIDKEVAQLKADKAELAKALSGMCFMVDKLKPKGSNSGALNVSRKLLQKHKG